MILGRAASVTVATLLCSSTCFAHGVHHSVLSGGTGIEAMYDSEKPMAYCEARVYSATNRETVFQEGITDVNGRFMFYPDGSGVWQVVVDDGMGHMLKAEVNVGGADPEKGVSATRTSHVGGAVLGVGIIFGLFGVYALFVRRRSPTVGS